MKRQLLLGMACMAGLTAFAGAPVGEWGVLIDGHGGSDNAYTMIPASDGDLFVATSIVSSGTTEEGINMYYGDEVVGQGAPNSATSGNKNLLIQRINPDGTCEWTAYSNMGDVYSAELAETSDGGIVIVMKNRYTNRNEGSTNQLWAFVDSDGSQSYVVADDPVLPGWIYQGVVAKLSAQGQLEWTKVIKFDYPTIGTKLVTDAFSMSAVEVDDEDNIYIGGNFRSTMTVAKADGSEVDIEANYVDGWNGDSQKQVGGLYILKLDAEGNYADHFTTSGDGSREEVFGLEYKEGRIYGTALERATENGTVNWGDIAVTPTVFDDMAVFCMDKNLTPEWVTLKYATPFSDGKHTTQIKSFGFCGNDLLLAGLVKGGFSDTKDGAELVASSESALEGFVLRMSSVDGSTMTSKIHGEGISGYFGAYVENDNIYAYGYSWASGEGIVLVEFPKEGEKIVHVLLESSGMPTAWPGVFAGTQLYIMARNRAALTIPGTDISVTPEGWGCMLAAYDLSSMISGVPAGVEEAVDNTTVAVRGFDGYVSVTTAEPQRVDVYNVAGQLMVSQRVVAGTTEIALPAGFYIVNGQKVIVK